MLRCATLLSNGAQWLSGIDPPRAASVEGSPAASTMASTHSCPTTVGVHSQGPTTLSLPLAMSALAINAVVVAIQSSGQTRPEPGAQWYVLTFTCVARTDPRFLTRT